MGFKMPDIEIIEKRYDSIDSFRRYNGINEYDLSFILSDMEEYDDKIKCPNCGLINYAEYTRCVNCGCCILGEKIIPGRLFVQAARSENFRQICLDTYGMLDEDLKVRTYKPEPETKPVYTQTSSNTSGGITIKYRPIPSTTSTDRAEINKVIEEQNKMFMEDQQYMRFLDNLLWMIPAFFGSYILNGSWMIRVALIIYFIHGCIRMVIAEERWKI